MAGYLILDSERLDEDAYAEFIERVAESAEAHGGKYLARGGATEVLEGDWTPHRVVVIEFDSAESAKNWVQRPELMELRAKAVKVNMMITVEGV